MRRLSLLALAIGAYLSYPVHSAQQVGQSGELRGVVRDTEGGVIDNAHIVVRADAVRRTGPVPGNVFVRTDNRGRYSATLQPGFYDVCVMADAFTPECGKVMVAAGKVAGRNVALHLDPLVMSAISDTFE